MNGAVWVELSGEIIIARLRGEPAVELLADCQRQVVHDDIAAALRWLTDSPAKTG